MRRSVLIATLALACLVPRLAIAATAVSVPAGGGLRALAVAVDVGAKELRYASCTTSPCAVSPTSPALPIPAGGAIDPKRVTVDDVPLAGGRHLVHVKVLLGAESERPTPAWEALLVAGSPPLFEGRTGWTRGEPGERAGVEVRFVGEGDHSVVVIGDIREDLRICGDDTTLLDPRGLDASSLVFHGATLQRIDPLRREAAIAIEAVPRHAPREPALAPLLTATDASSAIGSAAALTDDDLSTAWSEARPGRGQGEFVLLRAPFEVPIERFAVTIAPSAPATDGAAPERFYLATGAGTFEVSLPDDAWSHAGEAYDITLPKPIQTSCVALVLADAYTRGKRHPDVSIAELTAYSAFDHAGATIEEVAGALVGGDARAQAAAALLERAGARGIAALSPAYSKLDAPGRALAITVAASASSCATSASLLAQALADSDDVVRKKAAAKLEEPSCGREALPRLLDALKLPSTRAKVAPLIALIGRDAALAPLAAVLGDGTAEERSAVRSAVATATRGASPAALSALVANAKSDEAAVDLLRAVGDRVVEIGDVADARIAALLSVRAVAATRYLLIDVVGRLAARGDAASMERLAELTLRDPVREVRARAAELLANAREPEVVATKALADPEPRVREGTLHAIRAMRPVALEGRVSDLLTRDAWTFVRVAAADTLATLPGSPQGDRALGDALGQLSPRVREGAARALAARGARAYRDAIREHLANAKEEPEVRAAAARALGALCDAKAADELARMALVGASSPDPGDVSLGLVATAALGVLHPPDLARRFAAFHAKGVRPDARAAADRALAEGGRCPLP